MWMGDAVKGGVRRGAGDGEYDVDDDERATGVLRERIEVVGNCLGLMEGGESDDEDRWLWEMK